MIQILISSLVMTSCVAEENSASDRARHPAALEPPANIVLIMAEDMGPHLPVYGDNTVATPAIDALAANGTVFLNAYSPQASCSPARASLFTGTYPHQHGQLGLAYEYGYRTYDDMRTVFDLLHEREYYIGITYKIHVDPEHKYEKYFDSNFNVARFVADDTNTKDYKQALAYIDTFLDDRPNDRPFFLMAQTHDAHRPFKNTYFPGAPPVTPYQDVTHEDVSLLKSMPISIENNNGIYADIADYYNAIQRVDHFIAGLQSLLKKHGESGGTLIIFAADHGPSFPFGKLSTRELGLRVPMIAVWPGKIEAGGRANGFVSLLDISATIAEGAAASKPETFVGESLVSLAKQDESDGRELIYGQFTSHTTVDYWPMRSVRNYRYKLIMNLLADHESAPFFARGGRINREGIKPPGGASEASAGGGGNDHTAHPPKFELYDLVADPGETVNLADDPQYENVRNDLIAALGSWSKETKDPFLNEDFLDYFTRSQMEKQKSIRAWQERNPDKSFWHSDVVRADWTEQLDVMRSTANAIE